MTTAATATDRDGFVEIKAPELFKFAKVGDVVHGIFRSLEDVNIKKDDGTYELVPQYVIETMSGSGAVKFLATYDLLQKLGRRWLGCEVKITFVGKDESAGSQGNAMKVFEVKVKPRSRQNNPEITDDDLPSFMR